MSSIETHVRMKIYDGKLQQFKQLTSEIQTVARKMRTGLLRCDWFLNEERQEAVSMTVYAEERAMLAHLPQTIESYRATNTFSDMSLDILGEPSNEAQTTMADMHPRVFKFAEGFNADRAAGQSTTTHSLPGSIEIFTRFEIQAGQIEVFKAFASELAAVVRTNDRGTWRYDWFYDEKHHQCVAMDTYSDTQGMLSHMHNAHDAHEKLVRISTMTTEFLGELPDEVMAAVAKYNPFIVKQISNT